MPPLPLDAWRAEQLRVTVFPLPGVMAARPEWWEALTGSVPETNNANPRKGTTLVSGPFKLGKLLLGFELDRIDWVLGPQDLDPEAERPADGEPPNVGVVTDALGQFSDVIERWLARDDIPGMQRLAFGAVIKHLEQNHAAGYARLPDYVPVQMFPNSTDFLYQINRPIPSGTVEGLQLNRLSKWSIARLRMIRARLSLGGGVFEQLESDVFAFRMELDINTAASFQGPLPSASLIDLYRELVNEGLRVATHGVAGL